MTDGWHNDTSSDADNDDRSTLPNASHHPPLPEGVPVARPIALAYAATPATRPGQEMLLLNSKVSTAWKDLGVLIVGGVLALVIGELIAFGLLVSFVREARSAEVLSDEQMARMLGLPAVMLRAAALILLITLILRYRSQSGRSVGITRRSWGLHALLGLAACAVATGLSAGWNFLSFTMWPHLYEDMGANIERLMQLFPKMHPLMFGLVALMVAIYEELVFRGFIMTRLRRVTGSWVVAVLISTALFTLPHALDQELVALPMIGILSLVFSVVTIWRRSLIPAIVGHWVYNWATFAWIYAMFGDQWNP